MKPDDKALRFFLGANTPQGFVSRFDQVSDKTDGFRVLVIKGGPGSGKSTIIKRIAEKFGDKKAELIHCSSDVDSLDGIICPERRFAALDGTPPHTIEPKYPGAVESIVDISACWDEDTLYSCRGDIISLTKSISLCHDQACRFLSAAASLLGDTYRIALGALNSPKLSSYISRLCEREFKPRGGSGSEKVRFLSAVTNKGVISFLDTARLMSDRLYIVNDEYGAVSRILLTAVRGAALSAGHDIISCYCPLSPYEKLEHLFIPKLSLGFMTSNRFHDFGDVADAYRIVNCQRFSDIAKLKESKRRVAFNRKAALQMAGKSSELIAEAKKLHDELESYYMRATDYDKLNALSNAVVSKISLF